jgi:hypothetical protein
MRAIVRPAHSDVLRPALFANSQHWFTASSRGPSQAYMAMASGVNSGTLYLVIVRMLDEANHLVFCFIPVQDWRVVRVMPRAKIAESIGRAKIVDRKFSENQVSGVTDVKKSVSMIVAQLHDLHQQKNLT